MADTVGKAAQTPDESQPWAELGLKEDEYARIKEILGRRPTSSELAMYSVMWSEHCSYKSSKVHLRQFPEYRRRLPSASCSPASARTPALWTSGRAMPSHSRSSPTTIPVMSSRTRALPLGWAALSATSWPWEHVRSA